MKSCLSYLWLGAPALLVAMLTQAAPPEQMQQHQQMQQMHKTQQQNTVQAEEGQIQDCARFHNMERSGMDMDDPATREMMQNCTKMMGGQMQGGQMQGGQMQGGQMQGDTEQ